MDNKQSSTEETVTLTAYVHNVSPIKTSRKNSKFFHVVLQTGCKEYHDAVVFTPEKHGIFTMAASKETAIKLINVQSRLDTQDYTVKCSQQTSTDVADVQFQHRPPKDSTAPTIDKINAMEPFKMILKLSAAVYKVDASSKTLTMNSVDCEVKTCYIADMTGSAQLALWDSHIDLVHSNNSYTFTDLSTRIYQGKKHLTTTRNTVITQLDKLIQFKLPTTSSMENATLLHVTSPLESAKIKIVKQCPKCLSPQHNFKPKEDFHRCTTCKFLRKTQNYTTKCNGILTIKTQNGEIDMNISNSLLYRFIASRCDITKMDEQDVEQMLIRCDNLQITYTSDFHITSLEGPTVPSQQMHTVISSQQTSAATNTTFTTSASPSTQCPPPKQQDPTLPEKHTSGTDPVCPTPNKKSKKGKSASSSTAPAEDVGLDDIAQLFED